MHNVRAPQSITFGDQVLLTPGLDELGIPTPLSYIARVQYEVDFGYWVEKGQPLVTFHFDQYSAQYPPPAWMFWSEDPVVTHSFTLAAPVDGIAIDYRETVSRDNGRGGSGFMYLSVIEAKSHLPTLLLPKGVRPGPYEAYELADFSARIFNFVKQNWMLNRHNLGNAGGLKTRRLGDVSDQQFLDGYFQSVPRHPLSGGIAAIRQQTADPLSAWRVLGFREYQTSPEKKALCRSPEETQAYFQRFNLFSRDPSLKLRLAHLY